MLTKFGSSVWVAFQSLKEDTRGVSAIEYAILAALIIVVVVAGIALLGNSVNELFEATGNALENVAEQLPGAGS